MPKAYSEAAQILSLVKLVDVSATCAILAFELREFEILELKGEK